MKTKNSKLIKALILSFVVVVFALTLTACATQTFDASGDATITITLDKAYTGVEVSCPGGTITASGNTYSVKLTTRAETDVVVSCEGYYTEYINFKTKDLKSGSASKSITLRERETVVTVSVKGLSDMTGVEITSKNGFAADPVLNANKTFSLSYDDMVGDTIEIKKAGYVTNSITFSASDFDDYSLTVTAPLVTTGETGNAAVTFTNIDAGMYGAANIYRYAYRGSVVEASVSLSGGTDKVVYLDRTKDYIIGDSGNGMLITSKSLIANPYMVVDVSSMGGHSSSTNIKVTAPGRSRFESDVRQNNIYISVNGNISGVYQYDKHIGANVEPNDIKDTNTVRVLYKYTDEGTGNKALYALYETTGVTRAQLLAGIEIKNEVKNLTSTLTFVDDDGEPFTGYTISQYGSAVTYTAGASSAIIDINKMAAEDGYADFFAEGYTGANTNLGSALADSTHIARAVYDARIKFVDKNGATLVPEVSHYGEIEDGYYKPYNKVSVGQEIEISFQDDGKDSAGYLGVYGLIFSKDIFTYNSDKGFWEYTLPLYERKSIEVKMPSAAYSPENYCSTYIDDRNIDIYYDTEERKCEMRISSLDIGKRIVINISIYGRGDDYDSNKYYRETVEITQAVFDAGVLDLSNITPMR